MLKIEDYDFENNYRTIINDDNLFHKALKGVIKGETRFHIKNNSTGEDFDLCYVENSSLMPDLGLNKRGVPLPPFLEYDENNEELIYLDIFKGFEEIVFEEVNEYTVVLAKLILRKTKMQVIFADGRIFRFIAPNEKLKVVTALPEIGEKTYFCPAHFSLGVMTGKMNENSAEFLFTNVFLMQSLTDLKLKDIKYIEVTIPKYIGIGGLLTHITKLTNAFRSLGIQTYLKPDSTKFGDNILKKYFMIETTPDDANDRNTIYAVNINALLFSHFLNSFSADYDYSILNSAFIEELNEYKNAILGNKYMLGVLIRGTDYKTLGFQGARQQATVDEMLPLIREWMDYDHYDGIFLATEDSAVLNRMRQEFPGKIVAIAQERFEEEDLGKGQTLSDLYAKAESPEDQNAKLVDVTINYFYALYMLSFCESFMVSGYCNGWDVVRTFNHQQFRRSYIFQQGLMKPETES